MMVFVVTMANVYLHRAYVMKYPTVLINRTRVVYAVCVSLKHVLSEWKRVSSYFLNYLLGSKGCQSFGCNQKCIEQPSGPKCSCQRGFTLGLDNKTCQDINECEMDICAQNCTNTPGSFVCNCFSSEYSLRSDHVSCKANGKLNSGLDRIINRISNAFQEINLIIR